MPDDNTPQGEEPLSDDPQEAQRLENELLKLKMQAESGAVFGETDADIPPEVEAEFLQNVQRYEEAFATAREVTVHELLGSPSVKPLGALTRQELLQELERLQTLMGQHGVRLDVLGNYDPAVIYRFITEELFAVQTRQLNLPGWEHRFTYEDFHPNHKVSIGQTAQAFLNHWFEKGFDETSVELADVLITPDGTQHSRQVVLEKLQSHLNAIASFQNIRFSQPETKFEWDEEQERGLGHAEGLFQYEAVMATGETLFFEGPFKLYMSNDGGQWQIFYFVFPGFAWEA